MKLSNINSNKNILVIGASGSGKTHMVGTLCQLLPTTLVTADVAGLDTLSQMDVNPDVVLINDWRNIWDYYSEIAKLATTNIALAFDDFGAAQSTSRRKIERMPLGRAEEKRQHSNSAEFDSVVRQELMMGERRMQIQQWGELWISVDSFLSEILALPYALKLVTVLEGVATNPRDGKEHIYPQLLGQTRTILPAYFSLVAEAFVTEVDGKPCYCLSSKSHPRIETKDRYGTGRTWANPDMKNIIQHIERKDSPESDMERHISLGL